jgi:hypothetical protein
MAANNPPKHIPAPQQAGLEVMEADSAAPVHQRPVVYLVEWENKEG